MRNFFSKFFCPHFIDLEISLFCKQTGPRYVNKWLKQISLPFLYSPWIVETPELCYKKWPDFYLKLSRSISVKPRKFLWEVWNKVVPRELIQTSLLLSNLLSSWPIWNGYNIRSRNREKGEWKKVWLKNSTKLSGCLDLSHSEYLAWQMWITMLILRYLSM